MSWKDMFFKSDPFEDDEPKEVQKETAPVKNETQNKPVTASYVSKPNVETVKPIPKEPDIIPDMSYSGGLNQNVTFSGGLNQKIYEAIHAEVLEEKTPFSKFIDLYNKMIKIIPSEQQCVAAVITSMGVAPSEILDAINVNFKNALGRVKVEFDEEINGFVKDNIIKKENEMKEISDNIESNNKQILELQKQNEELAQKGKSAYDFISNNKYKLEQKKNDFNFALQYENQVIEKWINIISNFDKSTKEIN
jgi:hypothetical protein